MTDSYNGSGEAVWAVGMDGSDAALNALEWAQAAAAKCGSTLELVRAWQVPFHDILPTSGWATPTVTEDLQAEAEAELVRLAEEVASKGVPARARMAAGPSAEALVEMSAETNLLVVGNRGLGALKRFVLGSTSLRVATHAPVPVIVVPQSWERRGLERVVVGVDGSPSSMAGLGWIHETVPASVEIVAVRLFEPYDEAYGELGTRIVTEMRADARQQFENAVRELSTEIGIPHRFATVFDIGRPGVGLLEMAADADLLVVGARGRSGLKAAVLGSTTSWILHNLECPTAVMPQD